MDNIRDDALLNVDKRLFYLSNDVTNQTVGRMCFNLLYILQEDEEKANRERNYVRKPIKIFISSYGGSLDDTWALIDVMRRSKTPIYTYCTGYAMSAGFLIFLAGDKRFVTDHSRLMYHQMCCIRKGKYQDLVEDREEMDIYQNEVEQYVVERSNIPMEKLKEIREKKIDWTIHSKEAIELGAATDLLEVIA